MRVLLALGVVAALSGCHWHGHHRGHPVSRDHRVVVVDRGHACHDACDHYHHGGRWYAAHGHRHGHGCGHHRRGGVWVVVD